MCSYTGYSNPKEDALFNRPSEDLHHHHFEWLREYRDSFHWVNFSFFFAHKNLILFPFDVILDCFQAKNHFDNKNYWWGALTVTFLLFPNIVNSINVILKRGPDWKLKALQRVFLLHFITMKR